MVVIMGNLFQDIVNVKPLIVTSLKKKHSPFLMISNYVRFAAQINRGCSKKRINIQQSTCLPDVFVEKNHGQSEVRSFTDAQKIHPESHLTSALVHSGPAAFSTFLLNFSS
ncbi:unnamed protein product [Rangifer tarandus platyrhynchus]|uniref:Uncharacterized protein n=1 Tax=Rangifer tarandus platyrhynchus TaxID=3082113 RepID=A0ABN8Y0U2_RANTA|nr:unnamed protein product [Rangifer tarandus platyrhynchus]